MGAAVRSAVLRLDLARFRSYAALTLEVGRGNVVLTGANGAGKTNILEAISLLSPGRGLRRATGAEMARAGGDGGFAIGASVEGPVGTVRLGTAVEPSAGETARRCRIEGANVPGAAAFAEHLRLVWLTPSLDGLFGGPASDRRRFLDRMVLAVDPEHGARVAALERLLRSRNRLLEERAPDAAWLDALERETSEVAVAVAAARAETIRRLAAILAETRDTASPFPWAEIALSGELEAALAEGSAALVEEAFRARLKDLRPRDRAAGRATEGAHLTDLLVRHGPKGIDAALGSTGEQKALLVGIVLAQVRLVAAMSGIVPVVLLDEVAAHLDPGRRTALFAALEELDAQVWITGADPAAFAELEGRATLVDVAPGTAVVRSRPGT